MVAGADLRRSGAALHYRGGELNPRMVPFACLSHTDRLRISLRIHHRDCGLLAVATRTEYRDEGPYTLVCNPARDFIPLDRLHACQPACVMVLVFPRCQLPLKMTRCAWAVLVFGAPIFFHPSGPGSAAGWYLKWGPTRCACAQHQPGPAHLAAGQKRCAACPSGDRELPPWLQRCPAPRSAVCRRSRARP